MTDKKSSPEIDKTLSRARVMLWLGIVLIAVIPFLLTRKYFCLKFNYSTTGQIGDTIGGTTAPFINLIGAFLVFYALKAQVRANELVQRQIDRESIDRELEREGQNLSELYSYLNSNIANFRFRSLPLAYLRNVEDTTTEQDYSGGDAFFHLFSQINCHFHGTQEDLHRNQSVAELLSILNVMDLLFDALERSSSKNREIIKTLTSHLFRYKIMTRVKDFSDEDFELRHCGYCNCQHGLPEDLRKLIQKLIAHTNN